MTDNSNARRSRWRAPLGWIAGALVVAAAVVAAYFGGRRPEPAPTPAPAMAAADTAVGAAAQQPVMLTPAEAHRIGVTYAAATMTPVDHEVRTVGQVAYDERRVSTISSRLDGWVDSLYVNFTGQPVRRGEPTLTIYAPMAVAAEEELVLAKRLQAGVSHGTADAQRGAAELVSGARRRLSYWDIPAAEIAQVESTGVVRKNLTLRSPVSGVVVDKSVVAGQRIMAGDALYRVVDLSRVWIEGEVFERDLPGVRLGQTVDASFEALPGVTRTGRITFIAPTLNAETRTASVRVELTNPGLALKPGMFATLRMTIRGAPNTLSVPRAAVLSTGERNIVFVKRPDGMLEARDVTLGLAGDDRIAVLAGLSLGDTVVTSATFLIDAESNLDEALGGMGNMPGMDVAPAAKAGKAARPDTAPDMPGMPGMKAPTPHDHH
ncbi:MAG TPA: efflux RND transporter periplasmic adaptor subunit [Gemmatimonadaceae bacterium]|nr:efflux RND transporter periplasmic adaptor subunit [Gemmatimonadaceae bacterium]